MYLCGAVLLFYVLQWTVDWVWGYFDPDTIPTDFKLSLVSGAIAFVVAVAMYRSDKYYTLASEVAGELKKVTWPSTKEVRSATIVVIVMASVSAIILFLFDMLWSGLTEMVYVG